MTIIEPLLSWNLLLLLLQVLLLLQTYFQQHLLCWILDIGIEYIYQSVQLIITPSIAILRSAMIQIRMIDSDY